MATHRLAITPTRDSIARPDWLIPAALIALSAIPTLAGMLRLFGLAGGTPTLADHARFAAQPLPVVLHIVGATGFAVLGALQFSPALRRRPWHRASGWALAPLGILGALSGMWLTQSLAPTEHDSPALTAMRLAAGGAMSVFLLLGLLASRRRDFAAHGRWMTRAYALGVAAGTQAFTLIPLGALLSWDAGLDALAMGSGWAINIVVAEWVIRRRAPAERHESMTAVVHERYGGPELLRIARVRRPEPTAGQVLIRVHASSLNAMDHRLMRANPFLVRLQNGFLRPTRPILGADVAGVVAAIGPGVTRFAVGDEVFGEAFFAEGLGAFAEYVCVREQAIVAKPASIEFIEAAALPLASVTALQAIRERAKVQPGHAVLIHGAGGGVGTFLVQIAKAYGAHVTAVCGPGSVELVRSLGADRVLDYTRDDFTAEDRRYDAIFGVNGFRPLTDYRDHLRPGGTYVMIGGTNRQIFEAMLLGKARFAAGDRKIEVLTIDDTLRASDLEEVRALWIQGRLRVVIDRVFPLEHAVEAFRYAERGHVRGKVVLRVE
ncbi:zinc-binding dehydrogenase [Sandaracinus amylolyticus]|uniref:zinc-binding dehydrogenase n=1 Tax=Sandaracinus amylolyticus TaxID=927083 RepID=UPI001F3A472A|nr:zinc-binding dehydrogenase [Sandaracinus amylolyticus]UJR83141.1 Hypothetical protein I5071_52070 [Sandaracinus amylolyticus]